MSYIGCLFIRCNDPGWPPHVCNLRTKQCEEWLTEHVGRRWKTWDWAASIFGVVILTAGEEATAFKLKFGL